MRSTSRSTTELYLADEAFICGTAVEVQPVVSVDRYQMGDGKAGPAVTRLEELFQKIVRGGEPRYAHWLTPVQVGQAVQLP